MNLIFMSCLVSIITLIIILYRKKRTQNINIPTWFLGSEQNIQFKIIRILSKPPFISFFLVLLITFLAGFIFYPKKEDKGVVERDKYIMIWVDPSLSAQISRIENKNLILEESKKISSMPFQKYGLIQDFILNNGIPAVNYRIEYLKNQKEIERFLNQQFKKPPSPYKQSLDTKRISKLIEDRSELKNKNGFIVAFSDGFENSLLGIFNLKKYFHEGKLVKSFFTNSTSKLKMASHEVIPTSNENEFVLYNAKENLFPEFMRPGLYKSEYSLADDKLSFIHEMKDKKVFPAIFVCTDSKTSYIELDPYISLREMTNFYGITLIKKNCDENENNDFWMQNVRKGILWVLPLTKKFNESINKNFQFITAKNFDLNMDSLVYVGDSSLNENHIKTPIQLDQNYFPLVLNLAPIPTKEDIGYMNYKGKFKINYISENKIPLGFKSQTLPFFYLRTPVSSINNELSRSVKWINFWLEALKKVKNDSANIIEIELGDINLINENDDQRKLFEYLNPESLKFNSTDIFTLGLYRLRMSSHGSGLSSHGSTVGTAPNFILFKNKINYNEKILNENEFNFNLKETAEINLNKGNNYQNLTILAYIMFIVSLFLLWYVQEKNI